ncbi:hypothetical protein K469DRAFT_716435 [Zopfia rhizophila CBS 207.26]|uniref:Fungal N-terminal domain-containing protein n=1 Tax=Zopfia rhizophila CBS 207.26 TaxID=1314779 RepID=A0A6A6DP77_9PEZI|nr:hypothetical protein K469DRAFT_716435 [Zopfia rhizophila CBS 207.26]
MTETFGVGEGILAVIDLIAKAINKCKHLLETAHDVLTNLRHIFSDISPLKAALESLHYPSDADTEFSDTVRNLN